MATPSSEVVIKRDLLDLLDLLYIDGCSDLLDGVEWSDLRLLDGVEIDLDPNRLERGSACTPAQPVETVVTPPADDAHMVPCGDSKGVVPKAVTPALTVGARVSAYWKEHCKKPGWYHGTVEAVGEKIKVIYDDDSFDFHDPAELRLLPMGLKSKRTRGGAHIVDKKRRRSSARTCLPDALHKGMGLIGVATPLVSMRKALNATFQDPSIDDANEYLAQRHLTVTLSFRPNMSVARLFQSQSVMIARIELLRDAQRNFHFLCVDGEHSRVHDNCGPTWQLEKADQVDNRAAIAALGKMFPEDRAYLREVYELVAAN